MRELLLTMMSLLLLSMNYCLYIDINHTKLFSFFLFCYFLHQNLFLLELNVMRMDGFSKLMMNQLMELSFTFLQIHLFKG